MTELELVMSIFHVIGSFYWWLYVWLYKSGLKLSLNWSTFVKSIWAPDSAETKNWDLSQGLNLRLAQIWDFSWNRPYNTTWFTHYWWNIRTITSFCIEITSNHNSLVFNQSTIIRHKYICYGTKRANICDFLLCFTSWLLLHYCFCSHQASQNFMSPFTDISYFLAHLISELTKSHSY